MTWDEFVEIFEKQYISKAVRNEKQVELCRLQQREHEPIEEYDERFLSLCHFVHASVTQMHGGGSGRSAQMRGNVRDT